MSRIGFIGTGHIAEPMVRFLAGRGHSITVSERNAETASALRSEFGVAVAPNQSVVDASDIVFLCVRPHHATQVVDALKFRSDHRVISVMAGVSLLSLQRLCAPATDITMTIPLGFLEHGGCPLPVCPDGTGLRALFAPENPVLDVASEEAFNKHFAVCAFVPGVLDLIATAGAWLGQETGDPDQAARYVRQLVSGFLSALRDDGAALLAEERDALATEGTLSLQMVSGLRQAGTHEALAETLTEIGKRLEQSA